MNQNKRDFGSFHSSNAEELISLSEEEYVPPQPPFELPSFEEYKSQPPEFGLTTRRKHFYLEDCTFLNHGAMGSVLKEAMEVAQRWQIYTERQPLRTVDRELIPRLVYSTRRMASFINCKPTEIVLVSNVSTALSCVVKSLQFQPGDKIFCLSVTYGALKKLLRHRCKETGAVLQEEAISFPIHNKQEIIEIVREKLTSGTKLAVFDHIPSNTPFIMPLEEIIPICKSRGVPVLVDGAHALGSLPLDVQSLGAEFYTANAHKWLCAPKGCAFLYVKRELQDRINPNIVSHGFESGFHSRFIWQGLKDYSSFIALPTVLDFWECVGASKIREYMENLVRECANMLVKRWSSGLAAPQTMFKSMSLVRLPESLYVDLENVDYIQAEKIQNTLYHSYNIEVPIKAVGGALYVRISGHIYNQASDYVPLADAILEIAMGR